MTGLAGAIAASSHGVGVVATSCAKLYAQAGILSYPKQQPNTSWLILPQRDLHHYHGMDTNSYVDSNIAVVEANYNGSIFRDATLVMIDLASY